MIDLKKTIRNMAREEEIISDKGEKKNLAISKTFKVIFS